MGETTLSNEFITEIIQTIGKTPAGTPVLVESGLSISPFMGDVINLCSQRGWVVTGSESVHTCRTTQFTRHKDETPTTPRKEG